VDLKTTAGMHGHRKPNGNKEILLNFITPHQKWGIHSTYTDNLMMLTLNRGGPVIWLSEDDAKRAGIVDNDWVELFNVNGAIAARAVVSQRVKPGMVLMYHAQEKIINTPGSEITGVRGGIHNSVTRIVLKPTHMIGGYAQFSYGFNYYGTIGTNRDEFVVVRKMNKVDWLDTPVDHLAKAYQRRARTPDPPAQAARRKRMKVRAQIGMVLNLDKCIGCHTCSSPARTSGPAAPAWNTPGSTTSRPSPASATPRSGRTRTSGTAAGSARPNGSIEPRQGGKWKLLMKIFANPNLPEIDDYYEPFTFDYDHLQSAPEMKAHAHRAAAQPDHRQAHGEDRVGPELGRDPRRRVLQAQQGQELRRHPEGHLRRVREHLHDVPAAAVRALPEPGLRGECPSGSIYKREEDGIVLIDQDKCRGWRMCVSGCPYKKIYYNWKSGKAEKCIFCYPRIEAGQPTVCSETCVGRIRYLGVLLYDADRIQEAASVEHDRDLYQAQLDIFLDPNDPKVIAQARIDGIPDNWMDAARNSPVYKMAVDWKVALPLHPSTARCRWSGTCRRCRRSRRGQCRPCGQQRRDPRRQPAAHPGQVPGQPADRRRHGAGGARARAHAGHARLPARKTCRPASTWRCSSRSA
jgi:nitrate reductase alpha subunit